MLCAALCRRHKLLTYHDIWRLFGKCNEAEIVDNFVYVWSGVDADRARDHKTNDTACHELKSTEFLAQSCDKFSEFYTSVLCGLVFKAKKSSVSECCFHNASDSNCLIQRNSSAVFVSVLDASKALIKFSHAKLFTKLSNELRRTILYDFCVFYTNKLECYAIKRLF